MSIKRDPANEARYGIPKPETTVQCSVADNTVVSGVLLADTLYRVYTDKACYLKMTVGGEPSGAKLKNETIVPATTVDYLSTNDTQMVVTVSGVSGGGTGTIRFTCMDPIHEWVER